MEDRERGRGRDSAERSSERREPNRRDSGSSSGGSGNGSRHGHRRSPPTRDNGNRPPEPPSPRGAGGSGGGRRTPPEPGTSRDENGQDKKRRLEGSQNGNAPKRRQGDNARDSRRRGDEIIHTRPHEHGKKGNKGQVIQLTANYFRVRHSIPNWSIYKYHVDFDPEMLSNPIRKALVRQHIDVFGGYLFDGTQLFVTRQLHREGEDLILVSNSREGQAYNLKFRFTKIVAMTESESLQVLNLIVKRAMEQLHLQPVGRNLYDPQAVINMEHHRIQIWPGYATSIRQHETDILLNAEILHKVMRLDTVYDILRQTQREDARNFSDNFKRKVLGTTVLTAYNNKTYRIDDVDFDKTPGNYKFARRDGEISIADYYAQRYRLMIRDQNQPLLVSKPKARDIRGGRNEQILLVPELCRATGLTDDQRTNFNLKKDKDRACQVDPQGRINKLKEFNKRLLRTEESVRVLGQWNLTLDQELVRVPARVIPAPMIVMGMHNGVEQTATPQNADFYKNMLGKPVYHSVDLARWYFVYPKGCDNDANNFLRCFKEVGAGMKFVIKDPRREVIQSDGGFNYTSAIDKCADHNPQIIITMLRRNHADTYASIKKKCFIDRAVPSQVIVQRTINNDKRLRSVATKVAFQVLTKIDGAPWNVKIPVSGIMTIGFDLTTDSKSKKISFGALVATMDLKQHAEFFSCVSQHTNGEEISTEFSQNVLRALTSWYQKYGALPAQIIIYRDGVGDGQLMYVRDYEVNYLRDKLQQRYATANAELKLVFIVVSKNIKTKFFKQNQNPDPGTVVDDVVTLPERYDFFLVPQTGRQGTVTPTCFNVIHDTGSFPPDILQIMTYRHCHMYYNWQGTVRVPEVCQYARKLSFLVANSIHAVPTDAALQTRLYYL